MPSADHIDSRKKVCSEDREEKLLYGSMILLANPTSFGMEKIVEQLTNELESFLEV